MIAADPHQADPFLRLRSSFLRFHALFSALSGYSTRRAEYFAISQSSLVDAIA